MLRLVAKTVRKIQAVRVERAVAEGRKTAFDEDEEVASSSSPSVHTYPYLSSVYLRSTCELKSSEASSKLSKGEHQRNGENGRRKRTHSMLSDACIRPLRSTGISTGSV
jgi:hypothetical protein